MEGKLVGVGEGVGWDIGKCPWVGNVVLMG